MKGQEPKPSQERESFIEEYFRSEHAASLTALTARGLSEIEAYRPDHWYIGHDGTAVRRRYYSALYKGARCFVKLAINDDTIANEIFVNRYLTDSNVSFVPKTLLSDYAFGSETALLVTEFLPAVSDMTRPRDYEAFSELCRKVRTMLGRLAALGVSHNDLSESNLLISAAGEPVLTDFGIASAPGSERFSIDYSIHDGTYYLERDGVRTYDDAYSFCMIVEDWPELPPLWKTGAEYRQIKELIGANRRTVRL